MGSDPNKGCLRRVILKPALATTILLGSSQVFASFGQMKLCRGAWECGLLSSLFFGLFVIPVVAVVTVLVFGKLNPQVPPPRKRILGIVIGIVSYFIAVFAASLMNELIHVPFKQRFLVNVLWYLMFQVALILAVCKMWNASRIN